MRELKGKVAVVTGAGSGSGRERALAWAREGASVVMADVDARGMAETASRIAPLGVRTQQARCDVSKADELDRLAARTWEELDAADLLVNNAGSPRQSGGATEDWKWCSTSTSWAVHGIRAFVPRMLAGGDECHIVNTASSRAVSLPGSGVYCVSKHAVVLSECLSMTCGRARRSASVLCPAYVNTGIGDSSNRHGAGGTNSGRPVLVPWRAARQLGRTSRSQPAAVKESRFYVPLTRKSRRDRDRMRDILDEREPTDVSRPVEPRRSL